MKFKNTIKYQENNKQLVVCQNGKYFIYLCFLLQSNISIFLLKFLSETSVHRQWKRICIILY